VKRNSLHCHGFALLEALFVIGLLGFVALVGGQIFITINQTTQRAAQRQMSQMRFDQAIRALREDIWNASQCSLRDSHTLQLQLGEKQVIWTTEKSMKRTAGDQIEAWEELQSDLHFEVKGNTVTVVQDPAPGDSGGRVTLLNVATLLKGEAR
jgi:type II secretory pathway pseudopilin PulG